MTGRHAALGSVVPYYAWVSLDLYSTLTRAYQSVDSDLSTLYYASLCVLCYTRCVRLAYPIL
jgi:hypothetical protein